MALADFEPGPFLWRRGLHAMREAMNRNAPSTMRNQTIVPATSKMLSFITPTHTSAKEHDLVMRQNDAFRTEGISDFLKGDYKPGLESHDRKKA